MSSPEYALATVQIFSDTAKNQPFGLRSFSTTHILAGTKLIYTIHLIIIAARIHPTRRSLRRRIYRCLDSDTR